MVEYLVSASVSSTDDCDACGTGDATEASITFGFQDHACKAEDLETDEAADFLASIGITFNSKEAWEEFKKVGDEMFELLEE